MIMKIFLLLYCYYCEVNCFILFFVVVYFPFVAFSKTITMVMRLILAMLKMMKINMMTGIIIITFIRKKADTKVAERIITFKKSHR